MPITCRPSVCDLCKTPYNYLQLNPSATHKFLSRCSGFEELPCVWQEIWTAFVALGYNHEIVCPRRTVWLHFQFEMKRFKILLIILTKMLYFNKSYPDSSSSPTSLGDSTVNTIHYSRLTVCLPAWLSWHWFLPINVDMVNRLWINWFSRRLFCKNNLTSRLLWRF